ncbi:MAG: hypothetical protein D6682_05585 [Zetaproteobacteria bacterium]|nr:MAG: hypothetical protein D6682_05585 [Zetaproteobacteria bacterium]
MRRPFLLLISLLTLAVGAKLLLPLWSRPGDGSVAPAVVASVAPAAAPRHAASSIPQAEVGRERLHDGGGAATSSAPPPPSRRSSGAVDAVLTSLTEIAEISIARAAESLPSGKDAELLSSLRALQKKLDARKKALDERERKLSEMETRVLVRIDELKQMEAALRDMLKQEESIKSKKIKRLTAVYSAMKPERAAPVVAKMDLETVVKIFLRMDEKKVGKILSFLPPEKAVTISEALTRRIASLRK